MTSLIRYANNIIVGLDIQDEVDKLEEGEVVCALQHENKTKRSLVLGDHIMFVHCNMKIRPEEIWFLYDNSNFTNRKLKVGRCPKCNHYLARLMGVSKIDGTVVDIQFTRDKAKEMMLKCKNEIEYTSLDVIKPKGNPYGFKYGETVEKINKKTGEVTRIEKACDFYGNKEIVKKEVK